MTFGEPGAAVDVEEVTVRFGATVALDRFTQSVAPGEVLAVVGPSGCGKSTLLRAIAGLEQLASGRVRIDGQDLVGTPPHQRELGLMFQDHALFSQLDVAGNIGFGLRMRRRSKPEMAARVDELLKLVDLDGFGHRSVDELSGGEAQRVALARALAPSPRLLMLDEPLGSLDRVLREQLTHDLRRVLRELGHTAIHVTHDQHEAFALADRIAIMRDGQLVQSGRPSELWSAPADAFVAEFLGHPNIWDRGDQVEVVPLNAITIVKGNDSDRGELDGVVTVAEFQGERWRLTVATESHGEVHLEAEEPEDLGQEVELKINQARIITLPNR